MSVIHFGDRPETVLVTGATGFIGHLLVPALLADGHHVFILSRDTKKAARMFNNQVKCITTMDEVPITQTIDVMINLAGARILGRRWTAERKKVLRRSRIGLTQSLVKWIAGAQRKPRLLLSASAIGYYGIQRRDDHSALTETSPAQPIFMSDLCREWEAAAGEASRYGVSVACMRFGLVLGHQGALPMMMLPIRLGMGGPLGGGRQCISWIHVHDLLRAMAHIWKNSHEGVMAYNFTAPETVTQAEFSRIAAGIVRRPSFMPTPGLPMRLVLGEQADLLLEGQRVVPERLTAEGFSFIYPDLHKALTSLYGANQSPSSVEA
ncbi:TIGR01777 family oxidoreductase [Herbaspirillum sp. GCM10030257]|uniref:TIGR01777 family oxidoreductase n=1 Tax=Herbaspirillum sp. GCM10030257 TaxID=3273393 RepID=UPI003616B4B3